MLGRRMVRKDNYPENCFLTLWGHDVEVPSTCLIHLYVHILIKLPPQMSYKSTFMIILTSSPKQQQKPEPEMCDGGKIKDAVHNIFNVVLVFVYLWTQSMNIKLPGASCDNRWDKNGLDETQRPLFGKTYVSMYRLWKIWRHDPHLSQKLFANVSNLHFDQILFNLENLYCEQLRPEIKWNQTIFSDSNYHSFCNHFPVLSKWD